MVLSGKKKRASSNQIIILKNINKRIFLSKTTYSRNRQLLRKNESLSKFHLHDALADFIPIKTSLAFLKMAIFLKENSESGNHESRVRLTSLPTQVFTYM